MLVLPTPSPPPSCRSVEVVDSPAPLLSARLMFGLQADSDDEGLPDLEDDDDQPDA